MTVRELISKLQLLPLEAVVYYFEEGVIEPVHEVKLVSPTEVELT